MDQLIIGDKASFDDYGASMARRFIGMPTKKSIKETVPFSNVTYDFSAINGEVFWNERELEYVFEMMASTPEELEEMKTKFSGWVMNVFEDEIHDPFIPEYHFIGTYDDMKYEDDDGLDKTTVTVSFMAYPYKVANIPKTYTIDLETYYTKYVTIVNESAHKVSPSIKTTAACTVTFHLGDTAIKYETVLEGGGTFVLGVDLEPNGCYVVKFVSHDEPVTATLWYNEEVM